MMVWFLVWYGIIAVNNKNMTFKKDAEGIFLMIHFDF